MLTRLLDFQKKRGQFQSGGDLFAYLAKDPAMMREIETLGKRFLGKMTYGCSNCYFDTYIQLMLLNPDKAMAKLNSEYELRAGVLLQGDSVDQNMTNFNITPELSLYHLKRNPKIRNLFRKLPANIDDLLVEQKPEKVSAAKAKTLEAERLATKLQDKVETEFVNEIVESIKLGSDVEFIKESLKETKLVGTKELTDELLGMFIAKAQEVIIATTV